MTIEARAQKWREIKNLSDDQIHENLAKKIWNPETEEIAERELRGREQQRTLESLASSATASEKAAQASQHTANSTRKLVTATKGLLFATIALALITAYTSIIQPTYEKRQTEDLYIKTLKHSLPSIRAEIQQNIRMIDANQEILAKSIPVLNGLYTLEKPSMDEVVKYVKDTNVIISINNLRECINMVNQKIIERNNIYEGLIINEADVALIGKIISPKEETIKTTAQNCLSSFEKAQQGLDQIHTYVVDTEIK